MAETLIQLIRESSEKFGSRPALFFKPSFCYRRWNYQYLWEASGRIASLLRQQGLSKGERAIIWAPNRPEWVLSFFGCLRAGVIAVPIDMRSTADFVSRVAEKTRPRLALISRQTPGIHEQVNMPKLYIENLEEMCKGLLPSVDAVVGPSDLVEIMFTSGTTGDPKGVMISHRNLLSNIEATLHYIPIDTSYNFLSILPLSHMFEQTGGFLVPIRAGASITYPTSRQPRLILRTLQEQRITIMLLVPQALDLFIKAIEREVRRQGMERQWAFLQKLAGHSPMLLRRMLFSSLHRRLGGRLEIVVSGGAALDPEIGAKWELLGIKTIRGYGATEASPVISLQTFQERDSDSVGRPLPGVEVRIAQDGEVLVRGPNITSGYWEDAEKTAASFEGGWYNTGDLGTIDNHGRLHLKGRKKDMIVLADGQKVFPEDIEPVLRKHPAVTDAAVVGLPRGLSVEVHAVLLLQEPSQASQVVAWANNHLAERQQIQGFTVWAEQDFPRTNTLKVKKGTILDMLAARTKPLSAPATPNKKDPGPGQYSDLQRILSAISGVPAGSITSERNLGTDLSLTSLQRVELLSTIEEELGVYIDESQVSAFTTVGQLQALVVQEKGQEAARRFPRWGRAPWCCLTRSILQQVFVFPAIYLGYSLKVAGLDYLQGLQAPVLFIANHNLHLDNGLIMKAIPFKWRRRLAIAASAHLFRNPFGAILNPLLGNGFPFSKEGAIRPSLNNLGHILNEEWSVLIYPEGQLTHGGPMQPFRSGAGLIAVEAQVPVIPLKLIIHNIGWPSYFPIILKRGKIEIRFGKPLNFTPNTSYLDATKALEEAVRAL